MKGFLYEKLFHPYAASNIYPAELKILLQEICKKTIDVVFETCFNEFWKKIKQAPNQDLLEYEGLYRTILYKNIDSHYHYQIELFIDNDPNLFVPQNDEESREIESWYVNKTGERAQFNFPLKRARQKVEKFKEVLRADVVRTMIINRHSYSLLFESSKKKTSELSKLVEGMKPDAERGKRMTGQNRLTPDRTELYHNLEMELKKNRDSEVLQNQKEVIITYLIRKKHYSLESAEKTYKSYNQFKNRKITNKRK